MQYRTFGNTGCQVSALGFGCMRLPLVTPNDMSSIDEAATARLLESALEKGVNYLDTAYPYHNERSEPVIGKILEASKQRKNVYLATKMPSWAVQTRSDMVKFFEEQCQKLRTDHIDFYLLHNLNKSFWPKLYNLGVLDFLDELKREGRVREVGFSFHDDFPVFKEIIDAYAWGFCQIQYNYMDEKLQAGTKGFEYACSKGMGVAIMEPLRGGNLAQTPPADIQAIWDAAPVKRTPAEWALRWLLNKAGVSIVLSGMNTQAQVDENCQVCAEHTPSSLSSAEEDCIGKVRDLFMSKIKVPCTACGYCLPCPAGVNIPAVFNIYNQYHLFHNKFWVAVMYNYVLAELNERADACVACGRCEQACPQHIAIINELKTCHIELEACGKHR